MESIDWSALREAARMARARAYAPYSNFPVGAAGVTEDGRLFSGCNVENASYGVGLCAECVLVGNVVSAHGGRLVAVTVTGPLGGALMPCGRCRQILLENGGAEMLVDSGPSPVLLGDLLPNAFGATDLI